MTIMNITSQNSNAKHFQRKVQKFDFGHKKLIYPIYQQKSFVLSIIRIFLKNPEASSECFTLPVIKYKFRKNQMDIFTRKAQKF